MLKWSGLILEGVEQITAFLCASVYLLGRGSWQLPCSAGSWAGRAAEPPHPGGAVQPPPPRGRGFKGERGGCREVGGFWGCLGAGMLGRKGELGLFCGEMAISVAGMELDLVMFPEPRGRRNLSELAGRCVSPAAARGRGSSRPPSTDPDFFPSACSCPACPAIPCESCRGPSTGGRPAGAARAASTKPPPGLGSLGLRCRFPVTVTPGTTQGPSPCPCSMPRGAGIALAPLAPAPGASVVPLACGHWLSGEMEKDGEGGKAAVAGCPGHLKWTLLLLCTWPMPG